MKGNLDEEYHQHYALLVGGIVLLSGRSVSPEQLEMAGRYLMHFVELYDTYYGEWCGFGCFDIAFEAAYIILNMLVCVGPRSLVCDIRMPNVKTDPPYIVGCASLEL